MLYGWESKILEDYVYCLLNKKLDALPAFLSDQNVAVPLSVKHEKILLGHKIKKQQAKVSTVKN